MAAPRLNIRRDCPHGGKHRHGTQVAYRSDRCRCDQCREAKVSTDGRRRRLVAYGRYEPPLIDAEPARQHLRTLMAQGMGNTRVAQAAGVSHGVTRRLLYGCNGRPPSRLIRREIAAALLAVTVDLADGQCIDGTGTRRRMQALAVRGWSVRQLSRRLGYSDVGQHAWLFLRCEQVTVRTARRIAELYDELWDKEPPTPDPWTKSGATRTRATAAAYGWLPPLAWDENIDDPDAVPYTAAPATPVLDEVLVERYMAGTAPPVPAGRRAPAERREAIRRLAAKGWDDGRIGRRVGLSRDAVTTERRRHGIPAGTPREAVA